MAVVKQIILAGVELPLHLEELEEIPAFASKTVKFFFTYQNIRFGACFQDNGENCSMKVIGDAGAVPYTAESPLARTHIRQIIGSGSKHLNGGLRDVNGRIVLGCDVTMQRPITGVLVMTGLVRALMPLLPYMDLLSQYVRPPMEPPAKPGDRAVRPQWRKR